MLELPQENKPFQWVLNSFSQQNMLDKVSKMQMVMLVLYQKISMLNKRSCS